jgi:Dolichyl-phosphate-mannose-protein mannosyltransferase
MGAHRRLAAVAGALYACFWATAIAAEWFSDAPFYYQGRALWANDLAASATRWLPPSESLLTAAALVFLLPAIITAAIWLARRGDPLERWWQRPGAERAIVVLAVAIAVAASIIVAFVIIQKEPILDDERAYAFQANLFAHGHVGLPSPPHAFANPLILTQPMWTSGYPPGHSLVLAPAAAIHAEHFVPPLFAGVLVVAVWSFARDMFGPRHAALAALLVALSPFVWAIHGSMLSFSTSVTCIAVFVASIARADRTNRSAWLLLGGGAIGIAFITRPFEAVAIAAPFAVRLVWEARAHAARLGCAILGFVAIAWIFPIHNKLVTGSYTEMPYANPVMPAFKLGFTQSMAFGELVHSPLQAIGNLVGVIQRLDLWLFAWPGSLVLVVVGAIRRSVTRGDRMLRWALASFLFAYIFVPYPGTWDFGPTYYFALVPILVPLAVRGVSALRTFDKRIANGVGWTVLAGMFVAVTAIAPMHLIHLGQLSAQIREPWQLIEASDIGPAIVLVPPIAQRRAPGWAHGYPFELTDSRGASIRLIAPTTQRELEEAIAYLGAKPVYQLARDKNGEFRLIKLTAGR